MQHEKWYLTGLLIGCLLLCVAVLGVRWYRLAQRVPLASASPLAQMVSGSEVDSSEPGATDGAKADAGSQSANGAAGAASAHQSDSSSSYSAAEPGGEAPGAPAKRLDINTASQADLEQLPGIGPVLAERIVQYRASHGGFRTVSELLEVEGIGATKLAAVAELVYVQSGS